MCVLLRNKVFPQSVFSDDEFDLERPSTASDAPGWKRSKAPSRLGSLVAESRAISCAHSPSAALDEEERSLRRSASLSANAGKRALVREVSMSRPLRPTTLNGRARNEVERFCRCAGEAACGQGRRRHARRGYAREAGEEPHRLADSAVPRTGRCLRRLDEWSPRQIATDQGERNTTHILSPGREWRFRCTETNKVLIYRLPSYQSW
jgi:hypothetical protein